jgi:hypothetical protein
MSAAAAQSSIKAIIRPALPAGRPATSAAAALLTLCSGPLLDACPASGDLRGSFITYVDADGGNTARRDARPFRPAAEAPR